MGEGGFFSVNGPTDIIGGLEDWKFKPKKAQIKVKSPTSLKNFTFSSV